jgi:ATP-dependent protease ClpP protease subunit
VDKTWFKIQAKADSFAEIFIYDEIGAFGITAKDFITDYKAIVKASTVSIDIHINSIGGEVFQGNAIYSFLASQQRQINVFIEGIAASIASVIAMAGDTINIAANAMLMVHNPAGVVIGEARDMRKMADTLDKIKDTIINAYQKKTLKNADVLAEFMDAETWFTAEEAVTNGFADQITGKVVVSNRFDLSKFKNVPATLMCRRKDENMTIEAKMETVPAAIQPMHPTSDEMQQLQAVINAEKERKEGINALFSLFPEPEYQALYAKCLGNDYSVDQTPSGTASSANCLKHYFWRSTG